MEDEGLVFPGRLVLHSKGFRAPDPMQRKLQVEGFFTVSTQNRAVQSPQSQSQPQPQPFPPPPPPPLPQLQQVLEYYPKTYLDYAWPMDGGRG